jgi:RNA polymerase sigma factor (sigma-70 family)
MSSSPNSKKRESLTGEALDCLLRWLSPDPEGAGQRYEILQRKLTQFFEKKHCFFPEELADRTLDIVARRLAAGEVIRAENPMVYCRGVAEKVRLEHFRSRERKIVPLEDLPPNESYNIESLPARLEEEREMERQSECLTECLNKLPPEDRRLIEEYYRGDWQAQIESRMAMAARLGITPTGLRTRAHRIRDRLRQCGERCLERGGT